MSFVPLDNSRSYLPSVDTFIEAVGQERGLSYRGMLQYGLGEISLYCEQAPEAMKKAGVECIVADQVVVAARTVAERVNVPFVNFCNSVPMSTEADVPPYETLWPYNPAWWARLRNKAVYNLIALGSLPFSRRLNHYRRKFGFAPHRKVDETFSPLAQITQLVREFDFPFQNPRPNLHYVGPYQRDSIACPEFPYEKLDGRPVIFAVLGTLLGANHAIWQTIAESCAGLNAQLVISLGGRGHPEDYRDLPGQPLVVSFAPQREILKRVTLMITHGGLNSVMEALSEGVPVLSVPVTYDQPGVSMRIVASGVGEVIPFKSCRTAAIRPLVEQLLGNPSYKERAAVLRKAIRSARGSIAAADIIERVSSRRAMAAGR